MVMRVLVLLLENQLNIFHPDLFFLITSLKTGSGKSLKKIFIKFKTINYIPDETPIWR